MTDRPDISLVSFVQKYRLWIAVAIAAVLLAVILWGRHQEEPVGAVPEPSVANATAASTDAIPERVGAGAAVDEPATSSENSLPDASAPSADETVAKSSDAAEAAGAEQMSELGRLATLPSRPNLPADDPRTHSITVLRGLDKITAEITELDLPAGVPVQFGSLTITARACWSRPPEEQPETYAFLEIDDNTVAGEDKRIFSGWMMASSPALNSLEHPIYDVWVINCKTSDPDASSGNE